MSPRALRHVRRALRIAVITGAVLAGGLSPLLVRAQQSDDERARAHFLAGRSYMEQARYDDAAEQFHEAYRLSHRAEMLLNASIAYERALRFDEAQSALERYLEVAPDVDDRATLEERLRRLRQLRERAAAVTAGAEPEEREAETESATEGVPGSHRDGEASGGLATIDELGTVGIVVGGAGAVALIAALVTGILAHDQYQSLEERCGPDGRACPLGSQGDIDAGSGLALTSTVTTFTGLALVAAGAAVLVVDLTSNDSRGERHEARLGIGAGGLILEGRF